MCHEEAVSGAWEFLELVPACWQVRLILGLLVGGAESQHCWLCGLQGLGLVSAPWWVDKLSALVG